CRDRSSDSQASVSLLSEVETGLAGGIREGLHATVVDVAIAIEHDLRDALALAGLRDRGADLLGRVALRALACLAPAVLAQRADRHKGLARRVVHTLHVDVLRAPEHREPRPLGVAVDLLPDPLLALEARLV